MKAKYKVIGLDGPVAKRIGNKIVSNGPWAIVEAGNSAVVYDLLDSYVEAKVICTVLNEGKGPEWDKIRDEVEKRLRSIREERRTMATSLIRECIDGTH